jgi:outer membrane receptor protein involved in Fe transport
VSNRSRYGLLSGVTAAVLMALAAPVAAQAQEAVYHFDIPAQDLASALRAYGKSAHQQVSFDGAAVRGKQSSPLVGDYRAEDGLRTLLGGAGLSYRRSASGVFLIGAAGAPPAAGTRSTAAEAASFGAEGQVSELIVTAQKQEQKLKDVPLSVSAVTGQQIAARGATSFEDLQYSIPNLSAFHYGPGAAFIQIRGVSASLGAPTVGEYLDEMPISADGQSSTVDVRLIDMQRIEVVRGPQGTLYGEGAMGGALHYITADPELTTYSGSMEASAGHVTDGEASYRANAVLNLPIVQDKVGLRLVAGYQRDGGWVDNVLTGEDDINSTEITTLRGKLLIKPDDNTQVSLLVLHQEANQANQDFGLNRQISATVQTFNHNRYDLLNGVIRHDFGPVRLTESAGYVNVHSNLQYDLTYAFLPLLELPPPFGFGLPPGFITQIPLTGVTDVHIFANELRLSSDGTGRFNWTAGGYFRRSENSGVVAANTFPGSLGFPLTSAVTDFSSLSWSAFGEANYQVTDQLNLLVGARYFHDHKLSDTASTTFGFPSFDHGDGDFHSFDPRFNLRYEFTPDSMVYVNVAKGFRSGGFNLTSSGLGIFPVPPTYGPDSIWTYEAGTRQTLLDGRLEFDGAVYRSDWSNVQSSFTPPGSILVVTENGGDVSGWGFETSVAAHPAAGLTLTGTYGWNNLAYTTATADKAVGDPVDFAAHSSASASLEYRRPLSGRVDGFVRADYQHAGHAQITTRQTGTIAQMPARDLVGLRLGIDVGPVEASLFADNLFDEKAPIIEGPASSPLNNLETRPRTLGIDLKARF